MTGASDHRARRGHLGAAALKGPSLLIAAGLLVATAEAQADGPPRKPETAAIPPTTGNYGATGNLPQPLTRTDADRYSAIFRLQRDGDWIAADRQLDRLSDSRLLGHVLAERYLDRDSYRASYAELRDWLQRYIDLPQADRIYRMAVERRPVGAPRPRQPTATPQPIVGTVSDMVSVHGEDPQWDAGLAAWRAGQFAAAAPIFEKLAGTGPQTSWDRSAAAYWAARCYLKDRKPELVSHWLRLAAGQPRSFYGQLARRALGMRSAFVWQSVPAGNGDPNLLLRSARGQRALALLQIGETATSESELAILARGADGALTQALLAVSRTAQLPTLELQLGARRGGGSGEGALYPVPRWIPTGGFRVDRALLLAIARYESGFNAGAVNPSGARGLMQLMPGTAALLGGDLGKTPAQRKQAMMDPATNLALGQRYVERLLADQSVGGDLLMLAAAYNAGPGTLAKWRAQIDAKDPLLFLESLPSRETRMTVERILSNLWIYQEQLGQEAASLDALAAGAWTPYRAQDGVATARK